MSYVRIDIETGETTQITTYDFSLGDNTRITNKKNKNMEATAPLEYVADAIVAVDKSKGRTAMLFHSGIGLDQAPNLLLEVATSTGIVQSKAALTNVDGTPINALVYYQPGAYLTFSIHTQGEPGIVLFLLFIRKLFIV